MSQEAYQDMSVRFLEDRVKGYCLRLGTQKTSTSSTRTYSCNVVLEKRAENHALFSHTTLQLQVLVLEVDVF